MHVRAPELLLEVPGAHFWHCDCSEAGWNDPGGHAVHAWAPSRSLNRPAAQPVQLAAAGAAVNRPTEQLSHVAAPEEEDRPAAHGLQRLVLPAENLPESQLSQAVAPVRLLVAEPSPHERHLPSWAEGAYVPYSQVLHSSPAPYSPAWQSEQCVRSGLDNLPISQSLHARDATSMLNFPPGPGFVR